MVKNWNTLQRTGIPAVDMVADQVFYYRRINKPLKSLELSPKAYRQFVTWVAMQQKDNFNPNQTFQFDGVNINQGSSLMIKDVYPIFYEQ